MQPICCSTSAWLLCACVFSGFRGCGLGYYRGFAGLVLFRGVVWSGLSVGSGVGSSRVGLVPGVGAGGLVWSPEALWGLGGGRCWCRNGPIFLPCEAGVLLLCLLSSVLLCQMQTWY